MRKILVTLILAASAGCGFAQGKITVGTDVLTSLVTFIRDATDLFPMDGGLAGQPVPTDLNLLPSHIHLVFGLYAGQSSGSLTLQTVLPLNIPGGTGQQDGSPPPTHAILPWTGLTYMQVRVWDGAYPTYEAIDGHHTYGGEAPEFTMTPGTSIAYLNIWNGGGSTWSPGPILVGLPIPEPSAMALLGLGAMALGYWRLRRKVSATPSA